MGSADCGLWTSSSHGLPWVASGHAYLFIGCLWLYSFCNAGLSIWIEAVWVIQPKLFTIHPFTGTVR